MPSRDEGDSGDHVSIEDVRKALAHDYEIMGEIGRGGMGVVYKARQKSLNRVVAIKMLTAMTLAAPVVLQRFLLEARAVASLTHPNIVAVYQIGDSKAGHYQVMEFIEGQSLETLVHGRKNIPISWTVSLMITLAEAIHFAHTKGIIHRDLKPENILIDKMRRPVIMDFGIAKVMGENTGLTRQGELMGTPGYMAPEQAKEQNDLVGPHSDVYSLGAIMYKLLTGKPPFEAENVVLTIMRVVSNDPPAPVRKLRPEVDESLERIVMKCLEKQHAKRYKTAQELADALRNYRSDHVLPRGGGAGAIRAQLPKVFLFLERAGLHLKLGEKTLIGSGGDCDIVLAADDVSTRHCQILVRPDRVVAEDLYGITGTRVNDESIERCELVDGDRLQIGEYTTFVVKIPKTS